MLSEIIGNGIDRHSQVINATLALKVAAINNATGFDAMAQSMNEQTGSNTQWEIIDYISPTANGSRVYLKITEEVNCIANDTKGKVIIQIANGVIFEKNVKLKINYIPERIMHENNAYCDIIAGRAGIGKINLATGGLNFVHEDSLLSGINHVYNS